MRAADRLIGILEALSSGSPVPPGELDLLAQALRHVDNTVAAVGGALDGATRFRVAQAQRAEIHELYLPHGRLTVPPEDGADQNRTTAGSFTYQEQLVEIIQPFVLESVKWDLRAGTYTLSIRTINGDSLLDGVQVTVASQTNDVEFKLPAPFPLYPGWRLGFRMTRSASSQWSDRNVGSFTCSLWVGEKIIYDGTSYSAYTAPLRMVPRAGAVVVQRA